MHWPRVSVAVGIVVAVIVAAASPSVYFYRKYKEAQKRLERNPLILEEGTEALIEEVGKLIDLPKDETPTIATVSDVEKLKGQPFFAKAKNGDKVFIYNTAKKAVLYDPIAKKIIEVGPLLTTSPTPGAPQEQSQQPSEESSEPTPTGTKKKETPTPTKTISPTEKASKTLNIVLANGTSVSGITSVVEKELKDITPKTYVADKKNAEKRDYKKTLVIDITGNNKADAAALAKSLSAEVSTLPAGEIKPEDVDLMVIVGEDRKS